MNLRPWINLSHALAWHGTAQTQTNPNVTTYWTPDEPGLVAALLDSQIQQGLETELQNNYAGMATVRIDSIFTHKTPTVRFGGRSPVEIGDLLLVRQHFNTANHTAEGKALLLQAKKNISADSGNISSGNPNTQFELYRAWAPFEGVTRLAAGPWDFLKNTPQGRFGEYLAVFDGQAHAFTPPSTLGASTSAFRGSNYPAFGSAMTTWANGPVAPHASASATTVVPCPEDFAATLADFFEGRAGESFEPGAVGSDNDWSDFVNTMLGEAAKMNYTFVSRRTNVQNPTPRGRAINAFVAIQPLLNLAFLQQVQRHAPRADDNGLPDFMHEEHFFQRAVMGSDFVNELYAMDQRIRERFLEEGSGDDDDGIGPPISTRRIDRTDGDGGHVPVMLISSAGKRPLWERRGE